ncbi:protein PHOX1-like [Curcuma longa]|uniref:protein PHOX1-like n=1 Tax=Curcuma longa TaxID=136217 RepID=UPI003D9E5E61
MGKPTAKKTKGSGRRVTNPKSKQNFQEDMQLFVDMAQGLKEEGNRLFHSGDYEGALVKYENAIKLLPKNHADEVYLHYNRAACYMQSTPADYPRAIMECDLALQASPKYTKALLRRGRCFKALNQLELARKDIDLALSWEPNNQNALELSERLKKAAETNGTVSDGIAALSPPDAAVVSSKKNRKKSRKAQEKASEEIKHTEVQEEEPMKGVKLVLGDDIRWVQIPANCAMLHLRETVGKKFPNLKAVLIKYKDEEGDFVTITTSEELRRAEESADPQGSVRLYLTEVSPEHEPWLEDVDSSSSSRGNGRNGSIKKEEVKTLPSYIDDWIVQFAHLFKNQLGLSSDAYLNLHEFGMKMYHEAIEDTVTTEEAQEIFKIAEGKFQEMVALALFNWGNVHMCRARKRLFLPEDDPKVSMLERIKGSYNWAQSEYTKAGKRYEESLKAKPDFYEGHIALAQQQFEQARLSWYYYIGSNCEPDIRPSEEIFGLFNDAEGNMEKGMIMWEKKEEQEVADHSKSTEGKSLSEKMGDHFEELSMDEAKDQASKVRSQINILWGTILYERSIVEFKLDLPTWEEYLMAAVAKFKHAGISPGDITVTVKNHYSNSIAQEGLAFKIDEIVQAWNDMYDAKKWMIDVPSFRLEPLFRRRIPKLHSMLESA